MYSLDINFLKDRPELTGEEPVRRSGAAAIPSDSKVPLYAGLAVGLLLPAAVGGLWLFLQYQTQKVNEEIAQLDSQLGSLKAEIAQIDNIEKQIKATKEETLALAGVFNAVKPWSAMLQDIRDRIPPGIRIEAIEQIAASPTQAAPKPVASPPAPGATPTPGAPQAQATPATPPVQVTISGTARSFNDVNDFLLMLQRSAFVNSDDTQLLKAELIKNPIQVTQANTSSGLKINVELPKVVAYQLQTTLSDVPASELVRELERKGAVGLAARIKTLQNKGVIEP